VIVAVVSSSTTMLFHPVFHEEGVISMVRLLTVIVALLFVSIAAACCPVAHAQSAAAVAPAQEAAIEAGIKELPLQWSTAILKKDAAILERI
jgi:hypothetical protein